MKSRCSLSGPTLQSSWWQCWTFGLTDYFKLPHWLGSWYLVFMVQGCTTQMVNKVYPNYSPYMALICLQLFLPKLTHSHVITSCSISWVTVHSVHFDVCYRLWQSFGPNHHLSLRRTMPHSRAQMWRPDTYAAASADGFSDTAALFIEHTAGVWTTRAAHIVGQINLLYLSTWTIDLLQCGLLCLTSVSVGCVHVKAQVHVFSLKPWSGS